MVALLGISESNGNPESSVTNVLHRPTDIEDDQYVSPYGEQSPLYQQRSFEREPKYTSWQLANDKSKLPADVEEYDEETTYRRSRDERSTLNADKLLYSPRERRYSVIEYGNDGDVDLLEDALNDERLSEGGDDNGNGNLYEVTGQLLPADGLEFLSKSPDYVLEKSIADDTADREYEKAFSRKYKHRKKPLSFKFLRTGASRSDDAKKTEGFDYEVGGAEESSAEIERPDDDASPRIGGGLYTEGGIVRPLKHKIEQDGKRVSIGIDREFARPFQLT